MSYQPPNPSYYPPSPQANPGYGQQPGGYPPQQPYYQQPSPPYPGQAPFQSWPPQGAVNIQQQSNRQRPLGVTIVAILVGLAGFLWLIGAFSGRALPFDATLDLLMAVVAFPAVWGLWKLKQWAYWTTVALVGFLFVLRITQAATTGLAASGVGLVIFFLIAIGIVTYLLVSQTARRAFGL